MRSEIRNGIIMLIIVAMASATVIAAENVPTPPNEGLTVAATSRRGYIGSRSVTAEAGNVSELTINTSTITRGWQGYYGNITGVIVLDDVNNNTLYSWLLLDPEGEVYASRNESITWTGENIVCANITHIETEENDLSFNGIWGQDVDGINETFNRATHPTFTVGNNTFVEDECDFSQATYVNDAADITGGKFNETLLYSESEASMVYMAYVYQGGVDGFRIGTDNWDFQMIVPEDGHDSDTVVVQYYLWVELE